MSNGDFKLLQSSIQRRLDNILSSVVGGSSVVAKRTVAWLMSNSHGPKMIRTQNRSASVLSTTALTSTSPTGPTKEELGRGTWTLLHSIAAKYPEKPTKSQKKDVQNLVCTSLGFVESFLEWTRVSPATDIGLYLLDISRVEILRSGCSL